MKTRPVTLPTRRTDAEAHALAMTLSDRFTRWAAGFRRNSGLIRDYSQEDAESDCYMGIFRAAQVYDESKPCAFSTYAFWWARQSMRRGSWNATRVVRRPHTFIDEKTQPETRQRMGAKETHFSAVERATGRAYDPTRSRDDPVAEVLRREQAAIVHDAVRFLSPRNREILLRHIGGDTFGNIALDLEISRERVRQCFEASYRFVFGRLFARKGA